MAVSAPISASIDVALPITPEQVDDPKAFNEFMLIYRAIRALQSGYLPRYTTVNRPAWSSSLVGILIVDTTLNKLVLAGAAGWEVVQSA